MILDGQHSFAGERWPQVQSIDVSRAYGLSRTVPAKRAAVAQW